MLRESSQAKGSEESRMKQGKELSKNVVTAGDLPQLDPMGLSGA